MKIAAFLRRGGLVAIMCVAAGFFTSAAAAPAGFSGEPVSPSSLSWSWTEEAGVDGYRVRTDTGGILSPDILPSTTWWLETGLVPNTTYYRYVESFTGMVPDATASVPAVTLAVKPYFPDQTYFDKHVSSITARWVADGSPNPDGTVYVLENVTDSLQYTATQTSYTIPDLAPNTLYGLRVKAVNHAGISTAWSGTASIRTLANTPAAPGIAAVYVTSVSVNVLPGEDNPGLTQYAVRITSSGWTGDANYVDYDGTLSAGYVWSDTASWNSPLAVVGLAPDTVYTFTEIAKNLSGVLTSFGPSATVTTLSVPPADAVISGVSGSSLTLSWGPGINPAGTRYEVSCSTDNFTLDFSTPVALSSSLQAATTDIYHLVPNTTYYFRVRSFNGAGTGSSFAPAVSTMTLAAPPAGVAVTSVYFSSMTLAWSANGNPGDTRYEIVRSTDNFALNITTPVAAADNLTALACAAEGLASDTTYWFKVRAVSGSGEPTAFSDFVSSVTLAAQPDFEWLAISSRTVAAGWKNAGENPPDTRYMLQVSGDESFAGIIASSETVNAVGQARIEALTPNTTYYMRFVTLNRAGRMTLQDAVPIGAVTHAAAPSALAAAPLLSDRAAISWNANGNPGHTRYEVSVSTDNFSVHFATPVPQAAGLCSAATTVYNLEPETLYYFRVRAYNEDNTPTAYSNIIASVTAPAPAASVARDVNGDSALEYARNQDGDMTNGYETYEGLNSTATVRADGDGDGRYDFFISTAGSAAPEVYWDPDRDYAAAIAAADVTADGVADYVYDSNGDGVIDSCYNPASGLIAAGVSLTGTPLGVPGAFLRFDGGATGYQYYVDNSGASRTVLALARAANANAEFFIDTTGDGVPDRYADAQRGTGSSVELRDFDGDGTVDWGVDAAGAGASTSYYRRPSGPMLSIQAINRETAYVPVPNPFNPDRGPAVVVYDLKDAGDVIVDVYDIAGEKVAVLVNGHRTAGRHQVRWNGGNGEYDAADGETAGSANLLARGIYIIRYQLPSQRILKKIAVIR